MTGKVVEYWFKKALHDLHRGSVRILKERLNDQRLGGQKRAQMELLLEQTAAEQAKLKGEIEALEMEISIGSRDRKSGHADPVSAAC